MVGGKQKLSADGRLRLAGWPWPVERRLQRGVRAVDCMHGAGWIAAQRLREYVKLGAPDPTAKRRVFHAGQTLAPHVGGLKPLMTVVAPLSLALARNDRGTSAKEYFISISQEVQSFLDDKRPECCDFYYSEGGHRCSLTASVTNFKRSRAQ